MSHPELYPESHADPAQIIQAKVVFDWMRPWLAREKAAFLEKLTERYPPSRKRDPKKNFEALLASDLTEITGDPRYSFIAVATDIVFPSCPDYRATSTLAVRMVHNRYLASRNKRNHSRQKIV